MLQFSVGVRNARLDIIEAAIGTGAVLRIRTGPVPANCALPNFGTVLATITLPNDWLLPASGAAKSKSGTWADLYADASGVAQHFRIYSADGTCQVQGTVSDNAGSGDMKLTQTPITAGQYVTITSFVLFEQNG